MNHDLLLNYVAKRERGESNRELDRWGIEQISIYIAHMLARHKPKPISADAVVQAEIYHAVMAGTVRTAELSMYVKAVQSGLISISAVDIDPILTKFDKHSIQDGSISLDHPKDPEQLPVEIQVHGRMFSVTSTMVKGTKALPKRSAWVEIVTRVSEGTQTKGGIMTAVQTQDMQSNSLKPYCNMAQYDMFIMEMSALNERSAASSDKQARDNRGKKTRVSGGFFPDSSPLHGNELRSVLYRVLHPLPIDFMDEANKHYEENSGYALAKFFAAVEHIEAEVRYVLDGETRMSVISMPSETFAMTTELLKVTPTQLSQMVVNVQTCLGGSKTSHGQLTLESMHGVPLFKEPLRRMADSQDLESIIPNIYGDTIYYNTVVTDDAFSAWRNFADVDTSAKVYVVMQGAFMNDAQRSTVMLSGGVMTSPKPPKGVPAIYLDKVSYGAGSNAASTYQNALTAARTAYAIHSAVPTPVWFCRQSHVYAEVLLENGREFTITQSSHTGRGLFLFRVIGSYKPPKYLQDAYDKAIAENVTEVSFAFDSSLKKTNRHLYAEHKRIAAEWGRFWDMADAELALDEVFQTYVVRSVPWDEDQLIPYAFMCTYAQYVIKFAALYRFHRVPWNEIAADMNKLIDAASDLGDLSDLRFVLLPAFTRYFPSKSEMDQMESYGLPTFMSRVRLDFTDDELEKIATTKKAEVAQQAPPQKDEPPNKPTVRTTKVSYADDDEENA